MARDFLSNRKIKYNSFIAGICIMAVLFVLISIFMIEFFSSIENNQRSEVENRLKDMAVLNAASFENRILGYLKTAEIITVGLKRINSLASEETLSYLKEIADVEGFHRVSVDFVDGTSYSPGGMTSELNRVEYIDNIKRGEPFVSNVIESGGYVLIYIVVPIKQNDVPVAALRFALNAENIASDLDFNFYNSSGYYQIIDDRGYNMIDGVLGKNFFETSIQLEYTPGFSSELLLDDIKNKQSGITEYNIVNETHCAYYVPLGINNWYMLMVVPKPEINNALLERVRFTLTFLIKSVCVLVIIFGYFLFTQRQSFNKVMLNQNSFFALAKQSGSVVFGWDMKTNDIELTENFKEIFDTDFSFVSDPQKAISEGKVHLDDAETFVNMHKKILKGESFNDIRFRFKNSANKFVWCSASAVVVNDNNGRPRKIVGTLSDIDADVRAFEDVKNRSEMDLMTEIYNKVSAQNLISKYLGSETDDYEVNALFIIDLDNFKKLNDTLGHQEGDIALIKQTSKLKNVFRKTDIIGRIGGDEFIVLMKNVKNIDTVKNRGEELSHILVQKHEKNGVIVEISASIGIAIVMGKTGLSDIYMAADSALYEAKNSGKRGYKILDLT